MENENKKMLPIDITAIILAIIPVLMGVFQNDVILRYVFIAVSGVIGLVWGIIKIISYFKRQSKLNQPTQSLPIEPPKKNTVQKIDLTKHNIFLCISEWIILIKMKLKEHISNKELCMYLFLWIKFATVEKYLKEIIEKQIESSKFVEYVIKAVDEYEHLAKLIGIPKDFCSLFATYHNDNIDLYVKECKNIVENVDNEYIYEDEINENLKLADLLSRTRSILLKAFWDMEDLKKLNGALEESANKVKINDDYRAIATSEILTTISAFLVANQQGG